MDINASWVLLGIALPSLAAAEDAVSKRLEASPRHHEWAQVPDGTRKVDVFVVYPEVKGKAPVVIVIHENRGLTDWVRSVADRLAELGVIAIAPDLLSGAGPKGGRTSDFPDGDAAREAISKLAPEQVAGDLASVADWAAKLPAASGKLAVGGFCWGGSQSFRFATQRKTLAAAYVFYGTAPQDKAALEGVACPVYGFYGGSDARVDATLPQTSQAMKELGKTFEPMTYEGAGHAFMRTGEEEGATEPNRKAREDAWKRWTELLKKL